MIKVGRVSRAGPHGRRVFGGVLMDLEIRHDVSGS